MHIHLFTFVQWCESGMFMPDPGSEFSHPGSQIQGQTYRGSRIRFQKLNIFTLWRGASKIKLKKVNKMRTVTVRRVIIFLNISRPPLLICSHCCLHQYKTLKAVARAIAAVPLTFSFAQLAKGKSLGRSKPATKSQAQALATHCVEYYTISKSYRTAFYRNKLSTTRCEWVRLFISRQFSLHLVAWDLDVKRSHLWYIVLDDRLEWCQIL